MKKKELKEEIKDLKGTIAGLKAGLMVPTVSPGPEHLAKVLYEELCNHGVVVPLKLPYEDLPAPMVKALRCAGVAVWHQKREPGTGTAEIQFTIPEGGTLSFMEKAPDFLSKALADTTKKMSGVVREAMEKAKPNAGPVSWDPKPTPAPTMAEAGFNAGLYTETDLQPKEPVPYTKSVMPKTDVSKVRCIFLGQLDNDGTIPFALMKPEQKQKWRDLVDYIETPWVRRFESLDKAHEAWSREAHEIRMALNAGDETTIQAAERMVRELSRATAEWKAAQSTFEETHKAYLDANNRANALVMEVSVRDQRIAQLEADLEATQKSFEGADAVYQTQRTELDAAQGTALALEDEVQDLKGLVKNQADVIERADKKLFDLRNDWTAEAKKYTEEIDLLKNRLGVDSEKDATLAAMREANRTSRELEAIHIQLNDAKVPVFPLSAGSQLNHRLTWLIDRVRPKDWEALAGIIKNELNRNTAVNDAVDFAVHQMKAGVK